MNTKNPSLAAKKTGISTMTACLLLGLSIVSFGLILKIAGDKAEAEINKAKGYDPAAVPDPLAQLHAAQAKYKSDMNRLADTLDKNAADTNAAQERTYRAKMNYISSNGSDEAEAKMNAAKEAEVELTDQQIRGLDADFRRSLRQ